MSHLELAAAVTTLACVILTARQNVWCWPVGLVAVVLYMVLFFEAKLYSDMLLQVVYIVLQVYGWWAWLKDGPEQDELPVTRLPTWQIAPWLAAGVIATALLGGAMDYFTDAAIPYVDAFATVLSLIAQWMTGRKQLESWLVWIVADVVYVGIFLWKEMYPSAVLYAILFVLAVLGYLEWRKSLLSTPAAPVKGDPASA